MAKIKELDLTSGSILKKLFIYAVPFVLSNILQVLFSATDIAVLGIMVGNDAVAAVGANTALSGLLVNFFVTLSIGSTVVLSRYVGSKNIEGARRTVGASILIALIAGFVLLAVGVPCSKLFLQWMGCDPEILDMATVYLRIYFLGMPIMMVYNFSASILRATGDTKRPLIFLAIGGVANVFLNIMFILMGLTVEGVAIGTILSQLISATLSLIVLFKSNGFASLKLKYLRLFKEQVKEILRIGLPSAAQSVAFNIANVLIQSTVNSFGKVGMSANTTAQQFDVIVYNIGHAVSMSVMAFVGQNIGAKRMDRVKQSIFSGILLAIILPFAVGVLFAIFAPQLCGIIASGEEVIQMATVRLTIMGITYCICSVMEVFANSIRAMGKPVVSLIISIFGACILRILFLKTVFFFVPEFYIIYLTYPLSWFITICIYVCVIPHVYKKTKSMVMQESVVQSMQKENETDLNATNQDNQNNIAEETANK